MKICDSLLLLLLLLSSVACQTGVVSLTLDRACELYGRRGTYIAQQGDSKRLKCSWNGTSPVRSFTWTLNGKSFNLTSKVTTNYNSKEQRFSLESIGDEHRGEFACTIWTEANETASVNITLLLQGLPRILVSPEEAVYGSQLKLRCAHGNEKVNRIIWSVNGGSLHPLNRSWVYFSGNATFSDEIYFNVSEAIANEKYKCEVSSEVTCYSRSDRPQPLLSVHMSEEYALEVRYPIQLILTEPSGSVVGLSPNEMYSVNCTRHRRDFGDSSSITWYKMVAGMEVGVDQIETLQVTPLEDGGRMLRVYRAKPYHSGTYKCVGDNNYGRDEKSVFLSINDTGSISDTLVKLTGNPGVGTQLELMCVDPNIDSFDQNVKA